MEALWLPELLCRLKPFLLVVIQYVLWLQFCKLRSYMTLQLISDFSSMSGSVDQHNFWSFLNAIFTRWNPCCIMWRLMRNSASLKTKLSLVLADLVRAGPQPAVCWVLLRLAVSSAEELRCSWRQNPLWCCSFLQPADWTEWPCSPTPSVSLWAPMKIKTHEQDCQILLWLSTFFLLRRTHSWRLSYLDFLTRLGHILQHAEPVFVLTAQHQLLQRN